MITDAVLSVEVTELSLSMYKFLKESDNSTADAIYLLDVIISLLNDYFVERRFLPQGVDFECIRTVLQCNVEYKRKNFYWGLNIK